MAWVSADYYRNVYCGAAVTDEDFPRLEAAAQRYLEQAVFGRVVQGNQEEGCVLSPDAAKAVRDGVCALIEVLLQGGGEGIQSETLGDYAVTYAQEGGQRQSQRMSQTARRFLGSTGLAYRGRDWTDTLWILPPEDGDGDGAQEPVPGQS